MRRDRTGSTTSASVGRFAAEALAFAGLYLLCAGSLSGEELTVAILGSVLTVTYRSATLHQGRPFAGGLRDAARLLPRVAKSVAHDSLTMSWAFLRLLAGRAPGSRFVEVPFDLGGGDPASRTRRGLVVGAVSLAPNQYVTGVDFERRCLLVHQFSLAPTPKDPRWPV